MDLPSAGAARAWLRAFLAGAGCAIASASFAVDLESLVMPGELARAHAEVTECGQCHRAFDASAQDRLCIDCHKQAGADRAAGRGLHGRDAANGGQPCRSCHPDHKGRQADIVGLDTETFDHLRTEFALDGAHRGVACRACHLANDAYRDAAADCVSCHRLDDAHSGGLGEACADCHTTASWRDAGFDHSKTRFDLLGRHAEVSCGSCHLTERYAETPTACGDCHRMEDSHTGRFGADCARCHSPTGWSEGGFDHGRETPFALVGRHAEVACHGCHAANGSKRSGKKGSAEEGSLDARCTACHARDDTHDGLFGADCARCHVARDWKRLAFDHERETRFALQGAHAAVDCTSCHRGRLGDEKVTGDCAGCHADDDVHRGRQGTRCVSCHGVASWTDGVNFDHDMGSFPLLGLHSLTSCTDCHTPPRYEEATADCSSCHAEEDVHESRLGADCGTCHNPNGWALWSFDHDGQTEFPLRGGHAGLVCRSCHRDAARGRVRQAQECAACHAFDDPHRGSFGTRCESCHDEGDWRRTRIPR